MNSGYQRLGGGGKADILIKGYELSVIKWISSGDLMYSMVIIVNNNAYLKFPKGVDF